jgi:hypothetical protein
MVRLVNYPGAAIIAILTLKSISSLDFVGQIIGFLSDPTDFSVRFQKELLPLFLMFDLQFF